VLEVLRDLISHKGYANAAMLAAIRANGAAAADPELRHLLQHVLIANRFWLLTVLGLPFLHDEESRSPDSLEDLVGRYRRTQEQESAWMAEATDAELERTLSDPRIPGAACSAGRGDAAGLPAHAGSSRAVRDALAPLGRDPADDRLHRVENYPSVAAVARGSRMTLLHQAASPDARLTLVPTQD